MSRISAATLKVSRLGRAEDRSAPSLCPFARKEFRTPSRAGVGRKLEAPPPGSPARWCTYPVVHGYALRSARLRGLCPRLCPVLEDARVCRPQRCVAETEPVALAGAKFVVAAEGDFEHRGPHRHPQVHRPGPPRATRNDERSSGSVDELVRHSLSRARAGVHVAEKADLAEKQENGWQRSKCATLLCHVAEKEE